MKYSVSIPTIVDVFHLFLGQDKIEEVLLFQMEIFWNILKVFCHATTCQNDGGKHIRVLENPEIRLVSTKNPLQNV